MANIPVTFTYQDKKYSGYFSKVAGAASNAMYHLTIDGYHYGQLWHTQQGWRFANNQETFSELAEYFGSVVSDATGSSS